MVKGANVLSFWSLFGEDYSEKLDESGFTGSESKPWKGILWYLTSVGSAADS